MRISGKTTAVLATLAAGAIVVLSCATVERVVVAPPMIAGAKYVGMDQCATCHEKEARDFPRTQHSRLQLREALEKDEVTGLGCEACHGPGSLHVDAGGDKKLILSGKGSSDTCFQCHLDKRVAFNLQYHHALKEGKMTCSACHNPHGDDIHQPAGRDVARVNETCAQCHREQARPRVFEHEAMREGCTVCHNVHGSIHEKMLVERGNNLCLKCHGQIALPNTSGMTVIGSFDHTPFLKQGTCFSAGCHTAVHGSDVNSHLRY